MVVQFEIPEPSTMPVWLRLVVSALCWYILAFMVVRYCVPRPPDVSRSEEHLFRAFLWVFHPVIVPVLAVGFLFCLLGRLLTRSKR